MQYIYIYIHMCVYGLYTIEPTKDPLKPYFPYVVQDLPGDRWSAKTPKTPNAGLVAGCAAPGLLRCDPGGKP